MTEKYISRDGTPQTGSHWDWDIEGYGKPIITVDFHHTITKRCSACPGEDLGDTKANGEPQEGVVEALTELSKTFKIIIFTGSGNFWDKNQCQTIIDYLKKYGIPFDEIRFDKPPASYMIDDRALHHTSWENTLAEIKRRTFQTSLLSKTNENSVYPDKTKVEELR